jgi:hypothetical protein
MEELSSPFGPGRIEDIQQRQKGLSPCFECASFLSMWNVFISAATERQHESSLLSVRLEVYLSINHSPLG